MADELSEIVVAEIKQIAANGPKAEDLEKVREFMLKQWKADLEQNQSWMSYLYNYYTYGEARNFVANYENIVKGMTTEKVATLAAKILADNNMAYVVMRPEK
jgi:zinc protease